MSRVGVPLVAIIAASVSRGQYGEYLAAAGQYLPTTLDELSAVAVARVVEAERIRRRSKRCRPKLLLTWTSQRQDG